MPTPSRDDVDPRLIDGVLALAMALVIAVVIAADTDGIGRTGPYAYLFALVFGAIVLLRRHAPRLMLVATLLCVSVYYTLGFAPIGMALPAVAALYSAAELRRTAWAVGAGAVLVAGSTYFRVIDDEPSAYLTAYDLVTNIALAAAAIALGVAVRLTRETRERAEQIAILTAAEQASAAEQRLQAERVSIARDLHDVVGHSLSVISVHSGVASEAVGRDDAAARQALERVREATSGTLRELRATVKVLRTPGAEDSSHGAAGLVGIPALVSSARDAGLRVDTDVDVPPESLDAAIDAAAYRIVQEALTNVLRHSGARSAEVSARLDGDRLLLRIADDGNGSLPPGVTDAPQLSGATGAPAPSGGRAAREGGGEHGNGQGIAGMRERARMLGGGLHAGDGPDGGFVVNAELPRRLGT